VFRPTLARAGIRRIRFHDLRHTYATLLINQGANLKYISKQMGHASVQITLDRYGHLLPDTGREEMQKLDRVMDGEASNGISNVMPEVSLQGQRKTVNRGGPGRLSLIRSYESPRNSMKDRRRAHNPKVAGSNPAPATNKEAPEESELPGLLCFRVRMSGVHPSGTHPAGISPTWRAGCCRRTDCSPTGSAGLLC
jgi:hypothetical protein